MTESAAKPGTAPLPTVNELTKLLNSLQSNLGAFIQCDGRHDEQGKSNASATVIGAYRKLTATYQALLPQAQGELFDPLRSLHETIVTIGINVGPFRLKAPELPVVESHEENGEAAANDLPEGS